MSQDTPALHADHKCVGSFPADIAKLQAFIDTLTPEERTGPLKTVNQVRALGWGIALQMEAAVLQAVRPNESSSPTRADK